MASMKLLLSAGIVFFILTWSAQADPSDPCAIGKLKVSLESEDVHEGCGEQLVLDSVQDEPVFLRFEEADPTLKYILVLVDPDAPNSTLPVDKYWLHWFLQDIQGSDFRTGTFGGDSDEEVTHTYTETLSYKPPSPPVGSGSHRYQFYVYRQPGGKLDGVPSEARSGFDLDKFAERNYLGNPVAAFEFASENSGTDEL